MDKPPANAVDHAPDFAHRYAKPLEQYCAIRMQELGILEGMNGQPDYDGRWMAFNPYGRQGGENTTGVVIDSGVLNPELLKGVTGGRIYPSMRLRDRIDRAISHEYKELRHGGNHAAAVKAAPKTGLPISDEGRRLNRARARWDAPSYHALSLAQLKSSAFRSNPNFVTRYADSGPTAYVLTATITPPHANSR